MKDQMRAAALPGEAIMLRVELVAIKSESKFHGQHDWKNVGPVQSAICGSNRIQAVEIGAEPTQRRRERGVAQRIPVGDTITEPWVVSAPLPSAYLCGLCVSAFLSRIFN